MQRNHLLSLRFGFAVRQSLIRGKYSKADFIKDLFAGISVGIIAIPLSMALAIASGVAPQYGLYTAMIAGLIISLTGGSRFSVSGPTAAFVVILLPITEAFGLAGLLMAGLMSGIILIAMAVFRLGRLIQYIPHAVILGFTGGIGILIAGLQMSDFLGLNVTELPTAFIAKMGVVFSSLHLLSLPNTVVAVVTLATLILWPKLKLPVPAHLPALIIGTLLAVLFSHYGAELETVGSRFQYTLPDGSIAQGIPPFLPDFMLPWQREGADGLPLEINWHLITALLPSAFAIAMLGAIESLLCAVILDGMSGKRHSANSELLGQGIGNIITPFFGGITATAALARSAANFKAGAVSPIAGVVHALVVLAAILLFSRWLAYLPMASMAALLLVVAWNMSEAPKALKLIKTASVQDIFVFVSCLVLTVMLDMVVAITAGVLLSALLFVQKIAQMTKVNDIRDLKRLAYLHEQLPSDWVALKINGPMFFAAADNVLLTIKEKSDNYHGLILYMDSVTILDAGGLESLRRFIDRCEQEGKEVIFTDLQYQPLKTLARANVKPRKGVSRFCSTLEEAIETVANNPINVEK